MSETGFKSDLFRGMRARELSHLHDEVEIGDDAEGDAGEPVDGGGRHQHREPRLQEQRRRRGSPGERERVRDHRGRHPMRCGLMTRTGTVRTSYSS